MIETIDLTPTWRGVLRIYLEAYANGTAKGRTEALKELYRMADLADQAVADAKAKTQTAASQRSSEP